MRYTNDHVTTVLPTLYTFRRCPYAMRARWAIQSAGLPVAQVEVALRNKPAALLQASPKGTVPVLVLPDGQVIDQSLDIMLWALNQHDPEGGLTPVPGTLAEMLSLIDECEQRFKPHLDRYKYPVRFQSEWPNSSAEDAAGGVERSFSDQHFKHAADFLHGLNLRLEGSAPDAPGLYGPRPALADFAIAPFVRQLVRHDLPRAHAALPPALMRWLDSLLARQDFQQVMRLSAQ